MRTLIAISMLLTFVVVGPVGCGTPEILPEDPTLEEALTKRCGNGRCAGGETCANCPTDCGVCPPPPPAPFCGDGACSGTETCSTCAGDCGACPPSAGAQIPCGTSMTTISTVVNGLRPGEAALLARGCTYSGSLTISASGTSTALITLGAYGSGVRPIITGGTGVVVNGSFVAIKDLHVDNPSRPNASGDRGVGITLNGDGNVVQTSKLSRAYAGIEINSSSENNTIVQNEVNDNTKMQQPSGSDDDNGAFGILVHGHHNEIAYNELWGMDAPSADYDRDGAAVEIYGGSYNTIHHNLAWNCDAFTELGQSGTTDNQYAYNSFYSTTNGKYAAFVVTRGPTSFGPVKNTQIYNNSAMVVGTYGQGLVCYGGCDATILKAYNNAITSTRSQLYCDLACQKGNNLTSSASSPLFNVVTRADGVITLPLKSGSAAIDAGASLGLPYTTDVVGAPALVDGNRDGEVKPDIGAYEAQ